eukprot:gnl/MRDRNA2_/MRDRNA2_170144_c0_seq1.p1 gnl/MRDRNA2_/MRDRNA2_170144_c0~~gnl/MRDRNA2_/MRDRNA2_170144_c0_seq1.p1  ORF type:complete len:689 (-),score=197.55 gnl/MRDRNA2_/MRDRNA2_170144_c0_seq1:285-2159(-)
MAGSNQKFDDLQSELARVQEELENLKIQNLSLTEQLEKCNEEIVGKESKSPNAKESLNEMRAELGATKQELEDTRIRNRGLSKDMQKCSEALRDKKEQLADEVHKRMEQTSQLATAVDITRELRSALASAQKELADEVQKRMEQASQSESAKDSDLELKSELASFQKRLEELKGNNSFLEAQMQSQSTAGQDSEELQTKLAVLEAQVRNQHTALQDLEHSVEMADQLKQQRSEECATIKMEWNGLHNELVTMKSSQKHLTMQNDTYEEQMEKLQKEFDVLRAEMLSAGQEVQIARIQHDAAEAHASNVHREWHEAKQELASIEHCQQHVTYQNEMYALQIQEIQNVDTRHVGLHEAAEARARIFQGEWREVQEELKCEATDWSNAINQLAREAKIREEHTIELTTSREDVVQMRSKLSFEEHALQELTVKNLELEDRCTDLKSELLSIKECARFSSTPQPSSDSFPQPDFSSLLRNGQESELLTKLQQRRDKDCDISSASSSPQGSSKQASPSMNLPSIGSKMNHDAGRVEASKRSIEVWNANMQAASAKKSGGGNELLSKLEQRRNSEPGNDDGTQETLGNFATPRTRAINLQRQAGSPSPVSGEVGFELREKLLRRLEREGA